MQVAPETTTCVATTEKVELSLDSEFPILRAHLVPRFGEALDVLPDAEGKSIVFPRFSAPNRVKIEWFGTERFKTYVDVVDRHYFVLDDLAHFGDGQDNFYDLPEHVLHMARQAAVEVFEKAAHRSFVHRYGRTKDYGRDILYLDHNDVYELHTCGYRLISDCQIERVPGNWDPYPRFIEYFYGCDEIPAQVSRAVLELAAYMLRPSNRPLGATGESTDTGYIHFIVSGMNGMATDIPEVNAAIDMFGRGGRIVW